MSNGIYKEFRLVDQNVLQRMLAFIEANYKPCSMTNNPLMVIVTQKGLKRTSDQNARYWAIIKEIAEQAWLNGKQFKKEVWHEFFAREFGVCEDMELPNGEVAVRRKSTTEMTTSEFSDYCQHVEFYAASTLGVQFPFIS